jgi:hypothetical protein
MVNVGGAWWSGLGVVVRVECRPRFARARVFRFHGPPSPDGGGIIVCRAPGPEGEGRGHIASIAIEGALPIRAMLAPIPINPSTSTPERLARAAHDFASGKARGEHCIDRPWLADLVLTRYHRDRRYYLAKSHEHAGTLFALSGRSSSSDFGDGGS